MHSDEIKILSIIPARGGSKGIPKKNIRVMAGKPLISYSILNAKKSKYITDVVISTDDEEIEKISKIYGAQILYRPEELAQDSITLDPVIYHAVNEIERKNKKKYDLVITMQPTSPLLTTNTLDLAIEYFLQNSFDSVLSAVNKPHLSWGDLDGKTIPLYKQRLNRQYLPKHYSETGAFFISKRECIKENSRLGKNVSIFEVPEIECVDIDTPQDWWVAEKELTKKNIIIKVEGYNEIGTGHIFRGLKLAYNLIDHNVHFVISEKSDIGIQKLEESYFPFFIIKNDDEIVDIIKKFNCDILINDMLNTSEDYIRKCKSTGVRVINFEDLGEGAKLADAVINDLYEKQNDFTNYYWGSDYYLIKDEFLYAQPSEYKDEVKEIFVSFGGTDPNNLTQKVFNCINQVNNHKNIKFTFILGMGYKSAEKLIKLNKNKNVEIIKNVKNMSDYMKKADIAICSQGRTMLELASMAVPTILLAQNQREQNHEFGYINNGFLNLGLGSKTEEKTIIKTLNWLIDTTQIRKQIREHMLKKDLRNGLERVKKIILDESM